MIKGIGTDIIELARVRRMLDDTAGERFIERVLTEREREMLLDKQIRRVEWVAGRFAAKEAISKALGCGIGERLGFHDIEIVPNEDGKPFCVLSERVKTRFQMKQQDEVHITLSHSQEYAIAYAVWEG